MVGRSGDLDHDICIKTTDNYIPLCLIKFDCSPQLSNLTIDSTGVAIGTPGRGALDPILLAPARVMEGSSRAIHVQKSARGRTAPPPHAHTERENYDSY